MQVNDVIQVIYCSLIVMLLFKLSIVMQVNDVIQVIKLMMLYKLSRLLFVIYCYAS